MTKPLQAKGYPECICVKGHLNLECPFHYPSPTKECKCAENLEECLSCANDQHDEHCQVQYRIKTGSIEPKEWGERFNEEFVEYVGTRNGLEYIKGKVRGNDIKQFISSLLAQSRMDTIEEIKVELNRHLKNGATNTIQNAIKLLNQLKR